MYNENKLRNTLYSSSQYFSVSFYKRVLFPFSHLWHSCRRLPSLPALNISTLSKSTMPVNSHLSLLLLICPTHLHQLISPQCLSVPAGLKCHSMSLISGLLRVREECNLLRTSTIWTRLNSRCGSCLSRHWIVSCTNFLSRCIILSLLCWASHCFSSHHSRGSRFYATVRMNTCSTRVLYILETTQLIEMLM